MSFAIRWNVGLGIGVLVITLATGLSATAQTVSPSPAIVPEYDRHAKQYGVGLAWSF